VRDGISRGTFEFSHLDGAQLVKHAYGLRTAVSGDGPYRGRRAVLVYVYAEPQSWADGRTVASVQIRRHRDEVSSFEELVEGDDVTFRALSYSALIDTWRHTGDLQLAEHAEAIAAMFGPCHAAPDHAA
jgi:hypothetical protein